MHDVTAARTPRVRSLVLLLASALLASCDTQKPPTEAEVLPPSSLAPGAVSRVLISTNATTLRPGQRAWLYGFVEGLGLGVNDRNVVWTLTGPGTLDGTSGNGRSIVYHSDATSTGTVTVTASSSLDPRVSATIQLNVAQPSTEALQLTFLADVCLHGPCEFNRPAANTRTVEVRAQSTYELTSIVARLPGTASAVPLAAINPGLFAGTLDLSGVPQGAHALEVEATDTRGNTLVSRAQLVVDRPPMLTVVTPVSRSVATLGDLDVKATCVDDGAGCTVSLHQQSKYGPISQTPLVQAEDGLDTSVDLRAYSNGTVSLQLVAEDALGTRSEHPLIVASVVTHSALQRVSSVPGRLVEADGSRLLYVSESDSPDFFTGFAIRDRATGVDSHPPLPPRQVVRMPQLVASGAVFQMAPADDVNFVHERLHAYRPATGDLVSLDPDNRASFEVGGDSVIWSGYPSDALTLRNLATGSTVNLASSLGWGFDVAANGMAAFGTQDNAIVVYQDGTATQVTHDAPVKNYQPRTDGTLTAFVSQGADGKYALRLWTGAEVLSLSGPLGSQPLPDRNYAVHDGWVAFTEVGTGGVEQVWLRSPSGERRKVTDFGTRSLIEALGPDGRVAVRHEDPTYVMELLVSRADGTLQNLGPVPGRAVWLDGAWHVLIADSLFRVQ